jgi:hypothetical protein
MKPFNDWSWKDMMWFVVVLAGAAVVFSTIDWLRGPVKTEPKPPLTSEEVKRWDHIQQARQELEEKEKKRKQAEARKNMTSEQRDQQLLDLAKKAGEGTK